MDILSFGSCGISHIYQVEELERSVITAKAFSIYVGAKGLNQSVALARSGVSVSHAGCIGADGEICRMVLRGAGVDTTHLRVVDEPSGHAILQIDGSGRSYVLLYNGANGRITTDFVDEVLAQYPEGTILMVQNEINNLDYIIRRGYARGMKVVLTPACYDKSLDSIDLNMVSLVVLNGMSYWGYRGDQDPKKFCAYLGSLCQDLEIILTMGNKGYIWYDCKTRRMLYQPVFDVVSVAWTTVIDTFVGYFVGLRVQNMEVAKALRTAAAAAAISSTRFGESEAIPTLREVERGLKELKPFKRYNPNDQHLLETLKAYIAGDLLGANLKDAAQLLGYSTSHTAMKIKALTGLTFTQLLQQERCQKAAELLSETDLPIERIVILSGYKNGDFFRKLFQSAYGQSPHSYRNARRAGKSDQSTQPHGKELDV